MNAVNEQNYMPLVIAFRPATFIPAVTRLTSFLDVTVSYIEEDTTTLTDILVASCSPS
jgi:hypothetical protein